MGFTCELHSVTVYLVRGHYVRGLSLFEGCGAGGAGAPTQDSLCLHFDPPTMWTFKTDPLRHFFGW